MHKIEIIKKNDGNLRSIVVKNITKPAMLKILMMAFMPIVTFKRLR